MEEKYRVIVDLWVGEEARPEDFEEEVKLFNMANDAVAEVLAIIKFSDIDLICPLCGAPLSEVEKDKSGNAEYRCNECGTTFNFLSCAGDTKVLSWE